MACHRYLLLLPILACSTTPSTKIEQARQARHVRSPVPQSFQTNFDPISVDEVRDHFGLSDAGSLFLDAFGNLAQPQEQFQQLRFPNNDDQLLLRVEDFPEESLASRGDPDFLRRQQQSSAQPKVTGSFSEGRQQPRLHLPRQQVPNTSDTFPSFQRTPSFSQSNAKPTPNFSRSNSAPFLVTSKPITNPLLQKLFNRNAIPVQQQTFQRSQQPTPVSQPSPFQSQITGQQASKQKSTSEIKSLFERIKNRINEGRGQNTLLKEQPTFSSPAAVNDNNFEKSRSQSSLLRDQILQQKERQAQEISRILEDDQRRAQKNAEKQEMRKQIEILMAEKKEKEKLLMEALVEQRAQQELLRNNEEDLERKVKQEEERKQLIEEAVELERKRPDQDTPQTQAVVNAIQAVMRRTSSGSEKSSPAVWAAVKALSEFVESQENTVRKTDVPQDILMAIMQLTDFLNRDKLMTDNKERPEEKKEQSSLSPTQQRLRDRILKQKQQQEQQIASILNAETVESFMNTEQNTKSPSMVELMRVAARVPFPARILPGQGHLPKQLPTSPDTASIGTAFNFATLPVL